MKQNLVLITLSLTLIIGGVFGYIKVSNYLIQISQVSFVFPSITSSQVCLNCLMEKGLDKNCFRPCTDQVTNNYFKYSCN